MRGEDLISTVIYAAVGLYVLRIWWQDTKRIDKDEASFALPGTAWTTPACLWVAVFGALIILGLEVFGEYALEVADEQDTIVLSFLLAMCAAAIIEEVIFRGYAVITKYGQFILWGSVFLFSLLFTVLHPYLWSFEMPEDSWAFWQGTWAWTLDAKAYLTSAFLFLNSLFFYFLRFMPLNKTRSLLPCFVGHLVSNMGVFVVKAFQGFVSFG